MRAFLRDVAPAKQHGEEAKESERVVGWEETDGRQELRLLQPAGLGGSAVEDGGGSVR